MTHEVRRIGATRGFNGRRTIFYGHCTCGRGTTNSASRESVERKLRNHAAGDDRGMFVDYFGQEPAFKGEETK